MDDGSSVFDVYIHNVLHLVGVCILYYDYTVTLADEVNYTWSRPRSQSSWLFLINRYFSILTDVAVNWGNFANLKTIDACKKYAMFRQIMLVAAQVIVCFISFLRTYALYGRSRRVAAVILTVSAALFILACWSLVGQHSEYSIDRGCHQALHDSTAIRLAVAWEALFAYDSMIFGLTIYKTYRERTRANGTVLNNLIELIWRDGAIYFAVMACVNAANTLTFYLLPPFQKGILSTFASSVSVTMMSRIMLNLHQTAFESGINRKRSTSSITSTTANSSTLIFTSRIAMPSSVLGGYSVPGDVELQATSSHVLRNQRMDHGIEEIELGKGPASPSVVSETIELEDLGSPTSLMVPYQRGLQSPA